MFAKTLNQENTSDKRKFKNFVYFAIHCIISILILLIMSFYVKYVSQPKYIYQIKNQLRIGFPLTLGEIRTSKSPTDVSKLRDFGAKKLFILTFLPLRL